MTILQETKVECISDKLVKQVCFSDSYIFVFANSLGHSRGVLCVWDPVQFSCDYSEVHSNLVVLVGRWVVEDWKAGVIGLYALCGLAEHREFWQGIIAIISQRNIAWCVGGDFSMVMRVEERRGCLNSNRGIADFCELVTTAALCDTPLQGKAFTWFGYRNKCSRIDRFLVSTEWFQRFDRLVVINLPCELSDHWPIVLVSDSCDSGLKPFQFFNAWLINPQHVLEMECAWQGLRQK
ncbi:hypothetical protein V6N13_106682 [Hibiscus sabdariffa]